MAIPQSGIFALGTRSHYYLELDLEPGVDPSALVVAVAGLREPKMTTGGANIVTAFNPATWSAAGHQLPPGTRPLEVVEGADGYSMPATPHDAWIWVSGTGYDVVFDTARAIAVALDGIARVATELHGFTYRDSRDLTGFRDGTENPPIDEAAMSASVPDDAPGAGGSVVLVQKWVHDLGAFHALDQPAQEAVIGRTKDTDEELEDQPAGSHLAHVVLEGPDGEELQVFRRSASFGSLAEHGLLFVAFSADQKRLDAMLAHMAGATNGIRDRLTEYSAPVTGAYYFAPSVQAMRLH